MNNIPMRSNWLALCECGPLASCHWSWNGENKHPSREQIIWSWAKGWTGIICRGQGKEKATEGTTNLITNRAVTNSSDNPVSGANTGSELLKVNGDPPDPAWQIVLQSVCLPAHKLSAVKWCGVSASETAEWILQSVAALQSVTWKTKQKKSNSNEFLCEINRTCVNVSPFEKKNKESKCSSGSVSFLNYCAHLCPFTAPALNVKRVEETSVLFSIVNFDILTKLYYYYFKWKLKKKIK